MPALSGVTARLLPLLLAVVTTALLWGAYEVSTTYRMFASDTVSLVFHAAALAATTGLAIWGLGRLVGGVWLGWMLQHEPTRLQSRLVSALVAFVAVSLALRAIGTDVATLLASSAVVSLVIGLSVQPMLASLMAGLTVQKHLRTGDAVMHDGEACRVLSLNWRTVTLRRADGTQVELPNAKLADSPMQVLARDRPVRGELTLEVPSAWSPARVRRLVASVVESVDGVDATFGVDVLPGASDAGKPTLPYRVRYWLVDFSRRTAVQARIHARLWNAMRREGATAVSQGCESDLAVRARLALSGPAGQGLPAGAAIDAIGDDDVLPFDDGERIVVPERLAGRVLWLVSGAVSTESPSQPGRGPDPRASGQGAQLAWIEQRLALRIGPYASVALRRATAEASDLPTVCAALGDEIDDAAERAAFLREVTPRLRPVLDAGRAIVVVRDHAHQRLGTEPPLWAVGEAVVVAVPGVRSDSGAARRVS